MQRLTKTANTTVLRKAGLFAIALLCVLGVSIASPAQAQQAFETLGAASGLPTDNIAVIIARIIRSVIGVTGIIAVGITLYAGYLYLTANGEPAKVDKAKTIARQAIIGLVIIFSAFGITTFILNALLGATFGNGSTSSSAAAYTEPLSGSLGAGSIEDHYPERNDTDIARNTKIFITFKQAVSLASVIDGYEDDSSATGLNAENILIYPTDEGSTGALTADDVVVSYNEDQTIFVFDPVEYLGSANEDMNYTVVLTPNMETADGSDLFSGAYSQGYEWTFEVSTEVDLTPPTVTSVIPRQDSEEARNISVEITFSEAMNPVATTGTYNPEDDDYFDNIQVDGDSSGQVTGEYTISNGYKTITFTTYDACAEDPCGDTIYCLPGNEQIDAQIHAATVDSSDPPQAVVSGTSYDGVVDAADNSLDGDEDGEAGDDYTWNFSTTDEIEDTVPHIVSMDPGIEEEDISQSGNIDIVFNTLLRGASLNTTSVQCWPDPVYEMWWSVRREDDETQEMTTVSIEHPTLVSNADGGWDYWPVLTEGIKSAYQICMYPAQGPDTCEDNTSAPYCCNGSPSTSACTTDSGETLGE